MTEAKDKLAERRKQTRSGIYIPLAQRKKLTFRQLKEEYERVQKGEPYFEKPRKYYLKILENFLGKEKRLYQITPLDIEKFKTKRKETLVRGKQIVKVKTTVREGMTLKEKVVTQTWKPRSDISVNRELETFRTILNKAVEWGWLEKNPFERFKRRPVRPPHPLGGVARVAPYSSRRHPPALPQELGR